MNCTVTNLDTWCTKADTFQLLKSGRYREVPNMILVNMDHDTIERWNNTEAVRSTAPRK